MLKIYRDSDVDLAVLQGRRIAVIGYGSQGCAQSFMLKESGCDVVVGVRKGGKSWKNAQSDGHKVMEIAQAAKVADIIHLLLPDEIQAQVYGNDIMQYVTSGKTLSFSHGLNITFSLIKPPKGVDVIMVAPIAPGSEERKMYLENKGVPAYVAVHKNFTGKALDTALAMAKAMKFTKVGVMEISFKQETFTDLFGEQVVVCGGLAELVRNGFDTLVESGFPEEVAYFECLHQVELLARLLRQKGIAGMWNEVSNTAEYGGRKVGPLIIGKSAKQKMRRVLKAVENGKFAREFIRECKRGMPILQRLRKKDLDLPIEKTGERIRKMLGIAKER